MPSRANWLRARWDSAGGRLQQETIHSHVLHSGEQQRRITQSHLFATHSLCTGNFVTCLRIMYDIRMIHYFIVCLITLSTKTKHCQILRCLVNNKIERTRKVTVIIQFDVLYRRFPESTEKEHKKISFSIFGSPAEIWETIDSFSFLKIELVRILNYWLCC